MDTKEADKSRPSPSPHRYYKNIRLSSALCKWKGIKTAAAFFHGLIKNKKNKNAFPLSILSTLVNTGKCYG